MKHLLWLIHIKRAYIWSGHMSLFDKCGQSIKVISSNFHGLVRDIKQLQMWHFPCQPSLLIIIGFYFVTSSASASHICPNNVTANNSQNHNCWKRKILIDMAIETNGEEVHDHFKMAFQFNYFEMTPLNPDCPFHAVHSEFILIWTFAPITKSVKFQ